MIRRLRRRPGAVVLTVATSAVVGVAAVLVALTATLDLYWDPQAAVVQAVVAGWLVACPLFAVLTGGGRRPDSAVVARLRVEITGLRAEGERKDAVIAAFEDERIQWWDRAHQSQWADDDRLLPDIGDRLDWASINRKPSTATTDRGVPAPTRANP